MLKAGAVSHNSSALLIHFVSMEALLKIVKKGEGEGEGQREGTNLESVLHDKQETKSPVSREVRLKVTWAHEQSE